MQTWTFHSANDVTTVSATKVANGLVYVLDTSNLTTNVQYPFEEYRQTLKHFEIAVSDYEREAYAEYLEQRRASQLTNLLRFKRTEPKRAPELKLISPLIRWMAKALIGGQK